MSLSRQMLQLMPATMPDIACQLGITEKRTNALLYQLKVKGRAKLTDRRGARHQVKGPAPRLWERLT